MKSGASGGGGKISYTFDGATNYLIGTKDTNVSFNDSSFYGSWSTSYVNVKVGDSLNIDVKKALTINVNASSNSLYVQNYQLYYIAGEQSVTSSKDTVTLAADGSSTDTVTFTDWNIAGTVAYSATSGNTTDLPNANLSFSGKVLTITAGSNANAGITVTVKCQKSDDASTYKTTEITVVLTAANRNITGLTITTEPSTKVFLEGDNFAVTGLVVTCTFDAAPLSVTYNAASGNLGDLTYEIGNTELTIGSAIPGGAGTGSKTVTVSLEAGNNLEYAEYTITINAKTYSTLVTNVNRLYDGQKVWLSSAGSTGDTVLAAKHSGGNNIPGIASSITANGVCNELAERAEAYAYTMNKVVISSSIYYYFSFDVSGTTYYLKDTGTSSNNTLGRVTSLEDACYWTISVTGAGVATITNKSNTQKPAIRFNDTSSIFSCYAANGQNAFYLYAANAYSVANAALGFVENKMHMDANVNNQCNTYYPLAKASWNALSEDERLDVAVEYEEAYERLEAWAAAKGDKISDSDMSLTAKASANVTLFDANSNNNLVIIVSSIIGALTITGYFFIRRRKEN